MLDAARYWLRKGVDGYRVDHAEGPAADFWPEFRQACLEVRSDAWLFGEVGRPPPNLRSYAGELHGNLDFSLARALRMTFALKQWSLSAFEAFLGSHLDYFPAGYIGPAFIDNHDMNRFLFISGGDLQRLRLAALVLYTLPGPPVIYYGTERGISQPWDTNDGIGLDEARRPVDWVDDSLEALQDYFMRLNGIRNNLGGFQGAVRKVMALDDVCGLYAFRWESPSGGFILAVNTGSEPAELHLSDPGWGSCEDALNDRPIRNLDGEIVIEMEPGTGAVVVPA
jgi:glycosidase